MKIALLSTGTGTGDCPNRHPQFSGAMALHISELAQPLHNAGSRQQPYTM